VPARAVSQENSTFAQKLRIAEQPRCLWRSPGPNPLLRQGHLEPTAQDHVRMAFISMDGEPTTSLGILRQCLTILATSEGFLVFNWSFLWFGLCSLPLLLSLGITEKTLALSHLHSPIGYLLIRASLSLCLREVCKGSDPIYIYLLDRLSLTWQGDCRHFPPEPVYRFLITVTVPGICCMVRNCWE